MISADDIIRVSVQYRESTKGDLERMARNLEGARMAFPTTRDLADRLGALHVALKTAQR